MGIDQVFIFHFFCFLVVCFHFSAEAEGYSLAHMEFNVPLNALFFKFQFSLIFDCLKRRVYPTV